MQTEWVAMQIQLEHTFSNNFSKFEIFILN